MTSEIKAADAVRRRAIEAAEMQYTYAVCIADLEDLLAFRGPEIVIRHRLNQISDVLYNLSHLYNPHDWSSEEEEQAAG
jgi:hypothetical protein